MCPAASSCRSVPRCLNRWLLWPAACAVPLSLEWDCGVRKTCSEEDTGPNTRTLCAICGLWQPRYPFTSPGPVALRPCLATGLLLSHATECDTLRQHAKAKLLEESHSEIQSAMQRISFCQMHARINQRCSAVKVQRAGARRADH